jgi:hypothetical protein
MKKANERTQNQQKTMTSIKEPPPRFFHPAFGLAAGIVSAFAFDRPVPHDNKPQTLTPVNTDKKTSSIVGP